MQESAGNEYQNKSIGTDFSIQLIATQLAHENDSFGNDYDADATYPVFGTTSKEENKVASVEAEDVKINVPANAPAGDYTIEVKNTFESTDAAGNTTVSMDITLKKDGVKVSADGSVTYTVSVEIGKGYTNLSATHNGSAITDFDYDPVTGIFTFETAHFSPFTFTYKSIPAFVDGEESAAPVAFIVSDKNVAYYASLQEAIDAAIVGDTIVMLADVSYVNVACAADKTTSINVPAGKQFTLDLNGYVISGENNANGSFAFMTICSGASVTIDDTSASATGKITYKSTRDVANENHEGYTVRNKGDLTVNGGTIANTTPFGSDGYEMCVTTAVDNGNSAGAAAVSFTMNGGVIISDTYFAIRNNVYTNNTIEAGKTLISINGGTVYGFHFCDWGTKQLDYQVTIADNAVIKCGNYPDLLGQSIRVIIGAASTSKITLNISDDAAIAGDRYVAGVAAKIGDKYYYSLSDAIDEVKDGGTITLIKNVKGDFTFKKAGNFILDLNGYSITSTGTNTDTISVTGASTVLTVKNGTLETDGKNCGGIYVKNATAILENCTLIGTHAEESCGVYASNGSKVTVTNCKISAKQYGIIMMSADVVINSAEITAPGSVSANGSDAYDKSNLTINDGTFDGAIYWPAQGKLTINGGTFTDETALYVKSGSVEINGGTFIGNGEKNDYAYKDSGFTSTGAAIVIENVACSEYDPVGPVSITGGTFISKNNVAIQSVAYGEAAVIVNFISGGTFSSAIADELLALGFEQTDDGVVKAVQAD